MATIKVKKNNEWQSVAIGKTEIIEVPTEPIEPVIEAIEITESGTYTAPDGVDGYSPITVNVPSGGDAPTAEDLTFSGKLNYAFAFGVWDWFLDKYSNQITTKNVRGLNYCFHQSYADILFELNMDETSSYHDISATFSFYYGKTVPVIHKAKPDKLDQLFYEAASIVHVPEDFCDDWDWSYLDNTTGTYSGSCHSIFSGCYSLRSFPMTLFYHGNKEVGSSGVSTKYAFNNCAKLDEVIDFPWIYTATYDKTGYNGIFYNTFDYCHRLKNFTFAPMEVAPKWANQVIDLSKQAGWGTATKTNYDKTKEIKDDATYQALKDDPDCWTSNVAYSRYNKESAVRTLNSLPDTTATGSNTIKFKGEAGSLTDGGAINTLTEEEIAVAAAKGWTVSFV
jgi:hypothetical protein